MKKFRQAQICELLTANPALSCWEIAAQLQCSYAAVYMAARKSGLTFSHLRTAGTVAVSPYFDKKSSRLARYAIVSAAMLRSAGLDREERLAYRIEAGRIIFERVAKAPPG